MPRSPTPPTLTVTWRTEGYGRLDGVRSAFRLYDTVELDDGAVAGIVLAAKAAGYVWDDGRCAWIAWADSARERFIVRLQALDYAVTHAGSWSGPDAARPSLADSSPEGR